MCTIKKQQTSLRVGVGLGKASKRWSGQGSEDQMKDRQYANKKPAIQRKRK